MFTELSLVNAGRGKCFKHGCDCSVPTTRPDISSGGFPCVPFSKQRNTKGGTDRTSDASKHPQYFTTLEDLPTYLEIRRPRSFYMENVAMIAKELKSLGGRSALDLLVEKIAPLGYSCKAIILDHKVFVRVNRPRLFLIIVHTDCGGQRAAEWIAFTIAEAMKYRSKFPPAEFFDIVDVESEDQQLRLEQCEA